MEKIALVTGSSRGIGRAVAAELARQGWAVCINYRVREDCARSLLEQLTAMRQALPHPQAWREEYRRRCVNLGRPVRVLRGDASRQAAALDVDQQFGLTVRYENGETETVRSGEVSVRGLYGYIE